jgi:hypothetical protein
LVGIKVAGLLSATACLAIVIAGPTRTTAPRSRLEHAAAMSTSHMPTAAAVSQAQRMRSVTAGLRNELHAAAACHTRSATYEHCVLPALRHTVIGGRTAAFVLRTVINTTADPPCRAYLLELQAANAAASEQAQWTIQQLYDRSRHDRRGRAAERVGAVGAMLTRAAAPREINACSPVRDVLPA